MAMFHHGQANQNNKLTHTDVQVPQLDYSVLIKRQKLASNAFYVQYCGICGNSVYVWHLR